MATDSGKNNGVNLAPTSIRPASLRRLQFVAEHLNPAETTTDFITKAADERCRRIIRRRRIVLPPHLEFSVTP